ncbi:hypothetical protein A2U01_0080327 [Trifolium medium]|uniref:Uncharacterized protein n=1 Tax=Trifolium medium TaxID=97028 RepID=A0A392TDS1_9FABA|nr:hypothetical protein [Trifolium medium]
MQPQEMNSDQGKELLKIKVLAQREKARGGETRHEILESLARKSESSR